MNTILLTLHFLGFGMGFAVSAGNNLVMMLAAKSPPAEAAGLRRFPPVMARIGDIGLVLLWVTGVTMIFTKYGGLAGVAALPNPEAFWAKIICVVLITALVGVMHATVAKMNRGDMSVGGRMPALGKLGAVLLLLIIVFAVLAFE
jgi:hypothetical protein